MKSFMHWLQFTLFFTLSACVSIVLIILLTMPAAKQVYTSSMVGQQEPTIIKPKPVFYEFVEVTHGCRLHLSKECAGVYSGPGYGHKRLSQLRIGTVLKIDKTVRTASGEVWHRIIFDEWLRYPQRVSGKWYISSASVRVFIAEGTTELTPNLRVENAGKYILVDRSDQKMYAYDGDELFMTQPISSGLKDTPTPRGSFVVYRKTPSRYMQGPLPGVSSQYYDLPGVPWNLYFTQQGAVIHGAYWHNKFGRPWSHGCVNINTKQAKKLYDWAELGTPVYVRS